MNDILKLQPQSGLGDLIQLLPTIEAAISYDKKIIIATNHDYVLKPYGDLVETVPVTIDGIIPRINHGFKHLRYDRYGSASYRKRYFTDIFPEADYFLSVQLARARFKQWLTIENPYYNSELDLNKHIVFIPPRAAERHKTSKNPFQCAPDCYHAVTRARKFELPILMVGLNDLYAPMSQELLAGFIDCRDCFSFEALCCMIMTSKAVVSQIGAVSTLAGLFGIATDFLQSRTESTELHNKHVSAVMWPGQEVVK